MGVNTNGKCTWQDNFGACQTPDILEILEDVIMNKTHYYSLNLEVMCQKSRQNTKCVVMLSLNWSHSYVFEFRLSSSPIFSLAVRCISVSKPMAGSTRTCHQLLTIMSEMELSKHCLKTSVKDMAVLNKSSHIYIGGCISYQWVIRESFLIWSKLVTTCHVAFLQELSESYYYVPFVNHSSMQLFYFYIVPCSSWC